MSTAFRRACALVLICGSGLAVPNAVAANDAPVQALVMLSPDARTANEFASSIARWRADGLVTGAIWLDATAEQKEPGFSALLVLEMAGEHAWQQWERNEASRLPANSRVRRVDAFVHGERTDYVAQPSLFEVNVYRLETSTERYRDYCHGYIVPLMDGQMDAALMGWYTMYVERGDAGERYAVLVKAYRDPATYERAAAFKLQLRERLTAEHATYPTWHEIKETLRDNVSETLATWNPAG